MNDPTPELLFDGGNGSVVDRMGELDWTRAIGVSPEDYAPWGDYVCGPEHDADRPGGCETCDEHRQEAFDDLIYRKSIVFVARLRDVKSGETEDELVHNAIVAHAIDPEAALEFLRSRGAVLWTLECRDGDLFQIPEGWESNEHGGFVPSEDLLVRWLKESKHGCTIEIEVEQETDRVRGNALASGDDDEDRACEDEIIRRLDGGNVWAWCGVKVTCEANGETATELLGACSYASEADFRACGYFEDMVRACAQELLKRRMDWL